jgi:thymidine kinase
MAEQAQQVGSLSVFFGPMGSGKTTTALEQVSQFCALGFKTLYITHKNEIKRASDQHFYSHNPSSATLHKLCSVVQYSDDLPLEFGDREVIVIDEAQFFSNLVEAVQAALQAGKNMQVYGLSSNFKGGKFGNVIDLIPFADVAIQMTAKCIKCSKESRTLNEAAFTDRVGDSKSLIEVGGIGKYLPVCRRHHTQLEGR